MTQQQIDGTQIDTSALDAEAVALATAWVNARKQVRARLIDIARANHPAHLYHADPRDTPGAFNNGWNDNTVRKLYQYPADLSDERLLKLATTDPTNGK